MRLSTRTHTVLLDLLWLMQQAKIKENQQGHRKPLDERPGQGAEARLSPRREAEPGARPLNASEQRRTQSGGRFRGTRMSQGSPMDERQQEPETGNHAFIDMTAALPKQRSLGNSHR